MKLTHNRDDLPGNSDDALTIVAAEYFADAVDSLLDSGVGLPEAVDWYVTQVGGRSPFQWADSRGIQPDQVFKNIQAVEEAHASDPLEF